MAIKRTLQRNCQKCGQQQVKRRGHTLWYKPCGCDPIPGPQPYPVDYRLSDVLLDDGSNPEDLPDEYHGKLTSEEAEAEYASAPEIPLTEAEIQATANYAVWRDRAESAEAALVELVRIVGASNERRAAVSFNAAGVQRAAKGEVMKLQIRIGVVVMVDEKGRLGYGTSAWNAPGKDQMSDAELLSWAREGALDFGEEVKACIVTAEIEVEPHVEYVAGEVAGQ